MSADLRVRFVVPPSAIRLHERLEDPRRQKRKGAARASTDESTSSDEPPVPPTPEGAPPAPEPVAPPAPAAAQPPPGPTEKPTPDWAHQQRRFDELVRRVDAAVDRLGERIESELRKLSDEIVGLAVEMAERVVGAAVAEGRVDLAGAVEEAIGRVCEGLRGRKDVVVRVAPDDFETLKRVLAERLDEPERFRFLEDASLAPGTCELECEMRRVHVDLLREIERLRHHVGMGEGSDAG